MPEHRQEGRDAAALVHQHVDALPLGEIARDHRETAMNAAIVIQRRDRDAGPVAAATFAQLPVFIFEVAVAHGLRQFNVAADTVVRIKHRKMRSEEHTSELQSLMRISYAVFCLKKKK